MLTIGARTSMGKTAFVGCLASDIIEEKKRVLYMSFEMTPEEIIERMFCHRYRVNNIDLLKGHFDKHLQDWSEFEAYLKNIQFLFASDFGKTWKEIDSFINNVDEKPDLVIIDYIQAIAGASTHGKAFIDEYIRHFKQMCAENNFCGILVSQLNRNNPESKDKRPKLHELKGSGALEEHSDVVILLDWVCKHSKTDDELLYVIDVAKNRNGRTGFIKATFEPEYYSFKEREKEYQQTIDDLNT